MAQLEFILNTEVYRGYDDVVPEGMRKSVVEHVVCKDGTSLSVQASESHYCMPRTNGPGWIEVEIGFPTETPTVSWMQYFDGTWYDTKWERFTKEYISRIKWAFKGLEYYNGVTKKIGAISRSIKRALRMSVTPMGCDSVYGYVPVELVREYIEMHGGEA